MQIPQNLREIIQARYDARFFYLPGLKVYKDYSISIGSLEEFTKGLSVEERDTTTDLYGIPTASAYLRMQSALMLRGYNDEALIHAVNLSHCPEARGLLNLLSSLAPRMYNLNFVDDGLDIRDIISRAFNDIIDLLDGDCDFAYLRKKPDVFCGMTDDDKAFGTLRRCIIKNSVSLDNLARFMNRVINDLMEANTKEIPAGYAYEDMNLVKYYKMMVKSSSKEQDLYLGKDRFDGNFGSVEDDDREYGDKGDYKEDAYDEGDHVENNDAEAKKVHQVHYQIDNIYGQDKDDDESFSMNLAALYKPNMSDYLNRFWDKNGDLFFDIKTRKKFLADLKQYREIVEKAM